MSLIKRYSDRATQGKKVNNDSRPRSKLWERGNNASDEEVPKIVENDKPLTLYRESGQDVTNEGD